MKKTDLTGSFHPKKIVLFVPIFAIVLSLDVWTKAIIQKNFVWGESKAILTDFFNITYVRNQGAAFGFLNSAPAWLRDPFFIIVPILVMFLILFLFWKSPAEDRLSSLAFSLILSGALGNLLDRIRFGYVVDFLDFHLKDSYHWPAFNVADSMIVVGVCVLFLLSFIRKPSRV